ncbi:hypothetical protein AMELA_G00259730 [Ameiurus melas]|uniref:Piwi domain-containing protein n=1 Tax=Ameiurus melas TaxID=219545 RepID=A0A7J5ZNW5_AMEME|nr:hypothetical protein AMELA_G00259730 [Ameiurus melas]
MSRDASVQTTLSTWGLSFENKLLYLTGRVLPTERILQGARAYEPSTKCRGPVGIRLQRPGMIEYDDRQEALLRALQQNVGQQVQMVVVILSTNRKEKYACVKRYLCVDCPTPSQCVVARTLSRLQTLMTIATKISLQMNCCT